MRKKLECSLWKLIFNGRTNATYYIGDDDAMSVWFDNKKRHVVLTFRGSEDVASDGFTPIDPKPVNMPLSDTSYSIHHRTHR